MSFSVCIVSNEWTSVLKASIAQLHSVADELLIGTNGGFQLDPYEDLSAFPKLCFLAIPWEGYGATKNHLAQQARQDWILSLDADEVIDDQLRITLRSWCPTIDNELFAIKRINYFGPQQIRHGAWGAGRNKFPRLYHRKFTQWNLQEVHESLKLPPEAQISVLNGHLKHYTADNAQELKEKAQTYAALSRQKQQRLGKKLTTSKACLKAGFLFLKDYFFRLGFLDGKAGWLIARYNSLYTFWKYR